MCRGPERRLTTSREESYAPRLAIVGDHEVVVTWYDKSADGQLSVRMARWRDDGAILWSITHLPGRNPVIAEAYGDLFSAWIAPGPDGPEEWVWAQWFQRDGSAADNPRPIGPAGKTTGNLRALAGDFQAGVVVYDAVAGTTAHEVFVAFVGPTRIQVRRVTDDDGIPSKSPDVAGLGLLVLTWHDERDGNKEVYLLSVAANELLRQRAPAVPLRRVTATRGESIGAVVASYGLVAKESRVGVAWSDDTSGQHEIYFQPFDWIARPLGPPRRVTRNGTSSLVPAIHAVDDAFALAWHEYVPGTDRHADASEIAFTIVK